MGYNRQDFLLALEEGEQIADLARDRILFHIMMVIQKEQDAAGIHCILCPIQSEHGISKRISIFLGLAFDLHQLGAENPAIQKPFLDAVDSVPGIASVCVLGRFHLFDETGHGPVLFIRFDPQKWVSREGIVPEKYFVRHKTPFGILYKTGRRKKEKAGFLGPALFMLEGLFSLFCYGKP
jgi:hypothetical protein